jgi:hypothetical protein
MTGGLVWWGKKHSLDRSTVAWGAWRVRSFYFQQIDDFVPLGYMEARSEGKD